MMRPLHDRVVVELDETIPTNIAGLIIPIKVDAWRGKDGAIETYNRGTVVSVGPGKRDMKTGRLVQKHFDAADGIRPLRAGDVIRFSELQYHEWKEDGKRFVLITDGDVAFVEVLEAA